MFKSLALASMILVVLGLSLRSKSVSVDALTQEKATVVRDGQMTSKQ
jgi:hypothetical protein